MRVHCTSSAPFLDASCRFSSAASFRSQQREGQIARDKDMLQAQLLETIDGSLMQKKQPVAFQARASLTKWLEEKRLSRHALKFLEIGGQVFYLIVDCPNHLGLWSIGLSSHMMALITSGCGPLDCPPT